jgi:hypothetical protein
MNILQAVLDAQNGDTLKQLGRQFGLEMNQVRSAVSTLVPALAAGFQRNASTPQGADDLIAELNSGNHERYVEDTASLQRPETVEDGNGILSHVFGSKDVSRDVASRAAAETGVEKSVLKRMLPVLAAMVMGTLAKRSRRPTESRTGNGAGGILDMLKTGLNGKLGELFGR